MSLNLFKFQRKASIPKTQVEEPPSTSYRIRPRTRSNPHVAPTTATTTTPQARARTSHIYSIPPEPGMVGILITNGVQMTVKYECEVPYTGPLPEHSTALVQPVPAFRVNGKLSLFIDNRHFIALILDIAPYLSASAGSNGGNGVAGAGGGGAVSAVGSGDAPRIATQILDFANESIVDGTPYLDNMPNLSPSNGLGLLSMIPESGVPPTAPTPMVYPTPSITPSKNATSSPGAASQQPLPRRERQGLSSPPPRRRAETLSTAAEYISKTDRETFQRVQIGFLNTGPSLAGTTPRIEALLQRQHDDDVVDEEEEEDQVEEAYEEERDEGENGRESGRQRERERETIQARVERLLATPPQMRRPDTASSPSPWFANGLEMQGIKKNTPSLSSPYPSPEHESPSPSPRGGLGLALGLKGVGGSASPSPSPRGRIRRISTAAVAGPSIPTTNLTASSPATHATTTPAPALDIKTPRSRKPSSSSVSGTSVAVRSTTTPVPRPRQRVGSEASRRSNNNTSITMNNNNNGNLVRARTVQGHPQQQPQGHPQGHSRSHLEAQPQKPESQTRSHGLLAMGHRKPPPAAIAVAGGRRSEDTQNQVETRTRKMSSAQANTNASANSNAAANLNATATTNGIGIGNTNAKMGLGSKKTRTGFWHISSVGFAGFGWGGGGGGSKVVEAESSAATAAPPHATVTGTASTTPAAALTTPAGPTLPGPGLEDTSSGLPSSQSSRFRLEPRLRKAVSWESFNELGWTGFKEKEKNRGKELEKGKEKGKSKLREEEHVDPLERRPTTTTTMTTTTKGDQATPASASAPAPAPRQRRASHQANVAGSSSGMYASSGSGARRNVLSTSTSSRPHPYPPPSGVSSPRSGMSNAESRRLSARKDLPPIPYTAPLSATAFQAVGSSAQSPVRSRIREEEQQKAKAKAKDEADKEKETEEERYAKQTSMARKTTLGDVLNLTPPPRLALSLSRPGTGALSPIDYSMFESEAFESSSLAVYPPQSQTQTQTTHPRESSDAQYATYPTTHPRESSDTQYATYPQPQHQSVYLDASPPGSTTPSPITPEGKVTTFQMRRVVSVSQRATAKVFEAAPTSLERMRMRKPFGSVESLTTQTEHPEATATSAMITAVDTTPTVANTACAGPSGSNSTLSSGAGAEEKYQTAPSTAYTPSTVSGSWNLSVGGEVDENGIPLERAGKMSGAARAYLTRKVEALPVKGPGVAHPVVVHPPGRAMGLKRLPIEKF